MVPKDESSTLPSEGGGGTRGLGLRLDRNDELAEAADTEAAREAQNALLASIEARLTEEVRGLVDALREFAGRTQAIGEELPDSAKFCKLVTLALTATSFQLAYSFSKDADRLIFADDGCEYLANLGLKLEDLFRKLELDGRKFLAIALIDQPGQIARQRAEA